MTANDSCSPPGGIRIARSDGTQARALENADDDLVEGEHPTWSPDGSQILFSYDDDIYTVPSEGGDPLKIRASRHSRHAGGHEHDSFLDAVARHRSHCHGEGREHRRDGEQVRDQSVMPGGSVSVPATRPPAAGDRPTDVWSVATSADGDTVLLGQVYARPSGAAWVFKRQNATWTRLPTPSPASRVGVFGQRVALSSDGRTALVGAPGTDDYLGAAWV